MAEDQPWRALSPEIADLQDAEDAARGRFNDLAVVSSAENAVTAARMEELVAAQKKAWRRVSAARGRLTRAQRDGDAEKIATARATLDTRRVEASKISRSAIDEMQQIVDAGLKRSGAMFAAAAVANDAGDKVTDAIVQWRPPATPVES